MMRWSPFTLRFHFQHEVDHLFRRFFDDATDEAPQRPASWLPAGFALGVLEVRVPAPRAATPRTIAVKAA